jgi:gluconate 2-dehydrogenase gamma chain
LIIKDEQQNFGLDKNVSDCLFSVAMERRHFLTVSAAAVGGLLVYSLDGKVFRISGEDKPVHIPLRFFDEAEASIVAAATARIFPSDESGPGASEAGVVVYIDRQLAGPYGQDRYRYTQGPFENGSPDLGYQGKESPAHVYREGLKTLHGFDRLQPTEQDEKLKQIESTHFFVLLRRHTIEGMFCDPMHGGNVDMVGWQMLGFPGPQMSYRDAVDKHFGEAYRPKPNSLQQVTGSKLQVSEDEK